MIRNLKLLGVAAIAVLAVSGLGITGAQAASFNSAAHLTTVLSTPDGTGKTSHLVVDAAGASLTCNTQFASSGWEGTSIVALEVFLAWSECSFVGQTATVKMNGCAFNFEAGGNIDINCPAGKELTFSVPNPVCDVAFPSQQNKGTLTYSNITTGTSKEITVAPNVGKLKYAATGAGCPTTGFFEDGSITTGNTILTGYNSVGGTVNIEWKA